MNEGAPSAMDLPYMTHGCEPATMDLPYMAHGYEPATMDLPYMTQGVHYPQWTYHTWT